MPEDPKRGEKAQNKIARKAAKEDKQIAAKDRKDRKKSRKRVPGRGCADLVCESNKQGAKSFRPHHPALETQFAPETYFIRLLSFFVRFAIFCGYSICLSSLGVFA